MTFIDPRAKVLRHLDRIAAWRDGQTPAPVTVEWDLTNRCSLGCQDCHFAHTHVKGPWATRDRRIPMAFDGTGDLADRDLVMSALVDAALAGVRGVIWSGGGEPTLHPDWRLLVSHAHALRLEQGMYTLGGHFTADTAARLADQATFVVVSLDAVDAPTYAAEKGVPPARFDDACQGIRWLSGRRAAIGVSFLLHAGNWRDMGRMIALARALGATYTLLRPAIQFDPAAPGRPLTRPDWVTPARVDLERYATYPDVECDVTRFVAYRDWQGHGYTACQGPALNTTITPDGRVWICPNKRGLAGAALGDLRRESFHTIWARHPGRFDVDASCRVMCRLHPVNETLDALAQPRLHEAFV